MTRTPVQDVTLPGGAGTLALRHARQRARPHPPQHLRTAGASPGCRPRSTGCAPAPRPARSRPSASPASRSSSRSAPTCRASPYVTDREQALGRRPRRPRGVRVDHGPAGADLRLRQRRGHGRRRRARPRLRPPHHLARACRRSRCPRPSSAWCPAGAAATCCRTSSASPTPSRSSSRTRCRRTGCSRPRRSRRSASPTCCSSRPTSSRTRCAGPRRCSPVRSPCSAERSTATRPRGTPRATPPARSCSPRPAAAPPARCAPSSWSRAARTATRDEAFAAEDDALGDLIMADELRAGLYAFDLVQKRAKRPAGAPDKALARPVTKVGIVGAGLMAEPARAALRPPPRGAGRADRPRRGARGQGRRLGARRDPGPARPSGGSPPTRRRSSPAWSPGRRRKDGFADADFVIEAVFEEMAVKQQVFAEVEAVVSPECVLATNTSSLSITEMASRLDAPRAGRRLPLLQPGRRHAAARDHPRRGHRRRRPRHGVRRPAAPWARRRSGSRTRRPSSSTGCSVASWASSRGSSTRAPRSPRADRAVAGLAPMPPFVLLGLVGPAIALHNSETLHRAFGDRFHVSPSLRRLVEAGKRGYYLMEGGRPVPDPEVLAMAEQPEHPVELTVEQARERILGVLAEEVGRMLSEGVVAAPMDIDLAMITGAGFQFWNGGLCPLLDREGVSERVAGPSPAAARRRQRPRLSHARRTASRPPDARRRWAGRRLPDISQVIYARPVTVTTTSDTYLTRIGTLIRDARRHQGLTQSELADLLGTSQSAVARIEQGKQNLSPRDARPRRREARQRVRLARPQRPAAPADRRRPQALRLDPGQDQQERRRRPAVRQPAQQGPHDAAQPGPHRGGQPDHRGAHLDRRPGALAARQQRPRDRAPGPPRPRAASTSTPPAAPAPSSCSSARCCTSCPPSSCRTPAAATSAPAPSSRTCPRCKAFGLDVAATHGFYEATVDAGREPTRADRAHRARRHRHRERPAGRRPPPRARPSSATPPPTTWSRTSASSCRRSACRSTASARRR